MEQKSEQLKITKDTTIGDIIEKYPQTIDILNDLGVHCVGCHVSTVESLEMGFKGHGMSDEQINDAVKRLNEVVEKNPVQQKAEEKPVDLSNAKVTVTDKAATKIKEILEKEKKEGLRVSVQPGGCSGFQYALELDEKSKDDDIVIEDKGIKLFIDKNSMAKLNGADIDYVDSLQGAGFKVNNPNAAKTCGCGSSFG
jgi:iron-sulfur cluster assembly accessory protein